MRWLYYDPLNVAEVEYHTTASARFRSFWQAFGEKVNVLESALAGGTAWDWQRWLSELLANVDRRFHWQIVPEERSDRWRLAISTETHREARPQLHDFLATAPQLPGWSFLEYMPALAYPLARRWARQRCGVDCDHLAVKVRPGGARNLDLLFIASPDAPPASQQSWLTVAYLASEAILGEQMFDRFIGKVSMAQPTEARAWWKKMRKSAAAYDAVRMSELGNEIATHLAQQREELPAAPLTKLIDSRGWTTVEMKPTSDFPESRRRDIRLLTASVVSLPTLQAAHAGQRFCSALHSRFEETFCYVQWQHEALADEDLLARREQLELAIARMFSAQGGGCVIGGGIGEKYLYFDLAVLDPPQIVPHLRRALLEHQPPERCWLRFYDDELADEWVGIHPQALPPKVRP